MALNIPMPQLPLSGLNQAIATGGNLFSQMINPQIKREDMQRAWRQHLDSMELQKAQAGRAAQAAADAHKLAMMKMDPLTKVRELEALENYFKSKGGAATPGEQMPMPTQEAGQGLGMFNQEGLGEAQQQAQAQQSASNMPGGLTNEHLELMRKFPPLRGFYKQTYGIDPLAPIAQTPEEKQAAQLQLFKEKEKFKAEQEQKLPAAIKTLHENIIHLSPKAVKAIQHIIDIPSPFEPWGLGAVQSGQKAAHNKAVTAAAENYSKAKGWPNTKGSLEKAESILQRGNYETDSDYRKRLREYQDELKEGIQTSSEFLHPGKQVSNVENKSNDPLGIR